jgi:hypothetical protein
MPKHAAIRKPKPRIRGTPATITRAPAPSWLQGWRERIATSKLIDRLQTFSLADPDDPTSPRMTRTQAQVALSLLRKVLPDMQSLEISGNSDQPITVQVLRFSDPTDDSAPQHLANTAQRLTNGSAPMLDALEQPLTIELEARVIEDEPEPPKKRRRSTT